MHLTWRTVAAAVFETLSEFLGSDSRRKHSPSTAATPSCVYKQVIEHHQEEVRLAVSEKVVHSALWLPYLILGQV